MPYGTKTSPSREVFLRQIASAPFTSWSTTTYGEQLYYNSGTRAGESNPRWRDKIRRREDATTPFTASRTEYQLGHQWFEWENVLANGTVSNRERMYNPSYYAIANGVYPTPSLAQVTKADNTAKAYFNKRAKAVLTSTQGMVFLGQLKQTARMMTAPANGLIQKMVKFTTSPKVSKSLARARARRWDNNPEAQSRAFKSEVRNLNQMYLEATYGWQPLVNDVRAGAEALARFCNNAPTYKVTAMGRTDSTNTIYDTWNGMTRDFEDTTWVEVWYRGAIKQNFDQKNLNRYDLLGVNFAEALPTAWELLPWSFVYDYFGNIGDILEAASTPLHIFTYITRTERQFGQRAAVLKFPAGTYKPGVAGTRFISSPADSGYARYTKVIRSKASSTFPTPELKLPSLRQGINLASLGVQAALRGPQNFRSVSR